MKPTNKQAVPESPALKISSPSWKHIFAFTQWPQHVPILMLAVFTSLAVAGLKVILSVVLGRIFNDISSFSTGALTGSQTFSRVSGCCAFIAALGAGTWLANAAFLVLWVLFGELQGTAARNKVYISLAGKNMIWFDTQAEGVSSLLVQTET